MLSTLFFLLAIGAYVRYAQKPDWRRYCWWRRCSRRALMAKPMRHHAAVRPAAAGLLAAGKNAVGSAHRRSACAAIPYSRSCCAEKIPLLLLSAASAWITVAAQRSGDAVCGLQQFPLAIRSRECDRVLRSVSLENGVAGAAGALYPHPATALPAWQVILSALVLIGVTALTVMFFAAGAICRWDGSGFSAL